MSPIVSTVAGNTQHGMVSVPSIRRACTTCGRAIDIGAVCPACGPSRKQMTTTERGYGSQHQRLRRAMLHDAIGLLCPLCGSLMLAGEALDLDHVVPLSVDASSRDVRVVHASCNRSRGARL